MFLTSNPAQEGCTKHVHTTDHYICESVEFGEIKLYIMCQRISSSLISSQRILANKSLRMVESLFDLFPSDHNMISEEEYWKSGISYFKCSFPDTRF